MSQAREEWGMAPEIHANTDLVRAFVAIELPDEAKRVLADAQATLRSSLESDSSRRSLKLTNPTGIHLTLKFLGDVERSRVDSLAGVIAEATAGFSPFSIRLGNPGVFPNPRSPRVLWVGLEGDTTSLLRLAESVERSLSRLGFPPERRGFSPHLTLARIADWATPDDRAAIGRAADGLRLPESVELSADRVVLYRSELTRAGAIYSELASTILGRNP